MSADSIGVVTVTRARPDILRRRAMASVYEQDFEGEIEHVIVVDDDPASASAAAAAPTRPGLRVVVHEEPRPPAEIKDPPRDKRRIYPRLARLFNLGVRVSTAEWIAFLDDDNEFEPDHLRSLMTCANERGLEAVHSGRTMWCPDGSPYLDELWHTAPDAVEGRRLYELMVERGVRIPGSNVVLDRADPVRVSSFRPSTVLQADDPVMTVDQSVWLIRRQLLLRLPIPETFTEADHAANAAPDDKLLGVLVNDGVPIVSTGRPTVRYYLGGVSNNYEYRDAAVGNAWSTTGSAM
jgi:glycosyltransferase involved in cell wall biosynthesis